MESVERAYQLPSEDFEAVQRAPFRTAKIEVERGPMRVGVATIFAEDVEILLPLGAAVLGSNRLRQRPGKGVAPGDSEQLPRRVIDELRQLLDLVVEQPVAGMQSELALDFGDGRQMAKDNRGHMW